MKVESSLKYFVLIALIYLFFTKNIIIIYIYIFKKKVKSTIRLRFHLT